MWHARLKQKHTAGSRRYSFQREGFSLGVLVLVYVCVLGRHGELVSCILIVCRFIGVLLVLVYCCCWYHVAIYVAG